MTRPKPAARKRVVPLMKLEEAVSDLSARFGV
jgi:hypothetical protein